MRRDAGEWERGVRQGFVNGQFILRWREFSLLQEKPQHPVALAQQGFPPLAGVYGGGRVGEHGQGGGFRPRKFGGRMGKVAPGRGVQSHDIPPERRVRGIQGQNLILGAAQLQAGGQYHLHHLLGECPRAVSGDADGLHRQGAAPADDSSLPDVLPGCPCHGQGVDAGVVVEMPVLEGQQAADELAGHGVARREAPLAVRGDARAQ